MHFVRKYQMGHSLQRALKGTIQRTIFHNIKSKQVLVKGMEYDMGWLYYDFSDIQTDVQTLNYYS